MRFRRLLVAGLLGCTATVLAQPSGWAQSGNGRSLVEITLLAEARVEGPMIRIGHVARIAGGDESVRQAIAAIDLADVHRTREDLRISRDALGYRLLVAGHNPRSFRIVGEIRCIVHVTQAAESATDEGAVLVRVRDRVKLLAQIGATHFTAAGEAMQEGRLGDVISVRNVDSNRMVQGRIIGPAMVEVDR